MRRFGVGLLLTAGLLLAQEGERSQGEHGQAEHKGGVPEVSVLWKWANFAILFSVLGYLAVKNAGPLLAKRSEEIKEGLAAGERAKQEADRKAKAVDERLSHLDEAIEQIRSQARRDRERETARIERETQADIDRIHHHANLEIESAGKQAAIEARRFGARLALELAEAKIKGRMTPQTQFALLNNFEKTVAASAPSGNGPGVGR